MPAPQQANLAPVSVPEAVYSQVNTGTVAKDTQSAIAQMLKELPNSHDMSLLREELNSLYARLATVKDDTQAQNLINDSLRSLSERLKAQPNYDRVAQALTAMLVIDDTPQLTKALGLKLLHNPNKSGISLQNSGKKGGWLR
ncbi:hypothetical protein [Argonema galeatum]|uniref:hypothetical protein n=1 Tax=Argonema galeatum TaxID=2942762 RepID=UPI002012B54F|nr:hypothetical protein [Argonema galeatum]